MLKMVVLCDYYNEFINNIIINKIINTFRYYKKIAEFYLNQSIK